MHNKTKTVLMKFLVLGGALSLCLLILEIGIRFSGRYNLDDNFILFGRVLKPYQMPVQRFTYYAEEYNHSSQSRFIYNEYLGWSPRPSFISATGQYCYDLMTSRVDCKTTSPRRTVSKQNILRILIIGDSFSHGDEVFYHETFGYYLEQLLNNAGIPTEVINLAVGGYGIDQAFLRWQHAGHHLKADIVLLGLQFENIQRNCNIIRSLYLPDSGLPFSKPRYILKNDTLQLINSPTLPPETITELLQTSVNNWDLAQYEQFLKQGFYEKNFWYRSKLIALISEILFPIEEDPFFYDPNANPAQLTLKILDTFKSKIEENGSQLIIVHIPIIIDIIKKRLSQKAIYSKLLSTIKSKYNVITTTDTLTAQTKEESFFDLYMKGGHYSALGNKLIAQRISMEIIKQNPTPQQ